MLEKEQVSGISPTWVTRSAIDSVVFRFDVPRVAEHEQTCYVQPIGNLPTVVETATDIRRGIIFLGGVVNMEPLRLTGRVFCDSEGLDDSANVECRGDESRGEGASAPLFVEALEIRLKRTDFTFGPFAKGEVANRCLRVGKPGPRRTYQGNVGSIAARSHPSKVTDEWTLP